MSDVVNNAGGWDSDLVVWIWERVLEPKGIVSVILENGAIVFDKSLIKKG